MVYRIFYVSKNLIVIVYRNQTNCLDTNGQTEAKSFKKVRNLNQNAKFPIFRMEPVQMKWTNNCKITAGCTAIRPNNHARRFNDNNWLTPDQCKITKNATRNHFTTDKTRPDRFFEPCKITRYSIIKYE